MRSVVTTSSGEDGRRLEASNDQVDAKRQLPRYLGDRREKMPPFGLLVGANSTAVPEARIRGPPISPSMAMRRGTRPDRYIR
jgi:hypothetical protein